MNDPVRQIDQVEKPESAVRWWIAAWLISLWMILQVGFWIYYRSDRTYQVMFTWYVTPPMALLTLIWFLFFSRLDAVIRVGGLVALLALTGAAFGVFRHEGYSGDMVPQFAFRWTPTKETRVADYFAGQSEALEEFPEYARLEIADDDWPQFRGPERDGIVRNSPLRLDWEQRPPTEIWKQPIGLGWSSFAIVGEYAFTQEQRGDDECVVCYEAATGQQLWVHRDPVRFESQMGGNGPRATPTVFDSRLYSLGATGILNCLDPLTGQTIWTRNILEDAGAENLGWGMSGAPWVDAQRVVVNPGGKSGKAVIAYEPTEGTILWSVGAHGASYTAVRSEQLDGREQLLIFDGDGLAGVQPADGRELWRFPWQNVPRINVAQPIVHDGNVFISSGYSSGSALLNVSDIDESGKPRVVWTTPNQFKAKFSDPVYLDGFIYGLDENILSCIDASTGKRQWKRGRYGYGQILLHGEHLIVLAESGEVALVKASPERHEEVARFQAIEGTTWNHPVLNRGRLFVRNSEQAACFDVSEQP